MQRLGSLWLLAAAAAARGRADDDFTLSDVGDPISSHKACCEFVDCPRVEDPSIADATTTLPVYNQESADFNDLLPILDGECSSEGEANHPTHVRACGFFMGEQRASTRRA